MKTSRCHISGKGMEQPNPILPVDGIDRSFFQGDSRVRREKFQITTNRGSYSVGLEFRALTRDAREGMRSEDRVARW